MNMLVKILRWIHKTSSSHPRIIIVFFLLISMAGFASLPFIRTSPSLIPEPGQTFPVTQLLVEQIALFGDRDLLTIAIELPEPPGDSFVKTLDSLSKELKQIPGVKLVRFRLLDPEDSDQVDELRNNFLTGMDARQRENLRELLNPDGIKETFKKNLNLLWTFQNKYPILFLKILRDPVGLDRFMWESKIQEDGGSSVTNESQQTEIDSKSRATPKFLRQFLGNEHLLFSSPDLRIYLLNITPKFSEVDVVRTAELLKQVKAVLSEKLPAFMNNCSGITESAKSDMRWLLTGRLAFMDESYELLKEGIWKILIISVILCLGFILAFYRSLWATAILFIPIAAGIGPNYGLIFLAHDEINPLVMSVSGVLFGLGTDYGVHLWSRFTEEIDRGYSPVKASSIACEQTGPPVVIGAVTNILAFLCLCLSRDTGLFQLGYIGAIGLILTLVASLFLFPAIVALLANSKQSYYPRMRPRIGSFARVFRKMPGMTVFISGVVLAILLFGSVLVSYEKDLFKATYARDMDSTATAKWISGKFGVDFSQPTLLFFDAPDLNEGLTIQRQVDHILRELKQRNHEIVLFDSVSHIMAPAFERQANLALVSRILDQWPELKATFMKLVANSMLSQTSAETMKRSFDELHFLLEELKATLATQKDTQLEGQEIKEYIARVGSNYRFLTRILFSGHVLNSEEMNETHKQITTAMTGLPVQVNTCSPRQAMAEYIQNTNSEVFRLGLLVVVTVIIFFFALFRHPTMVALSLTPMLGAFASVFGVMGYIGNGLPNSMVAVAPLIFGLSMDNGVHVVMGSVQGLAPSVIKTMEHITRPILFISTTNVLGFVALLTSRHYPLEFLGWAMLIGTAASVFLSLVTLPAILLTMERRKSRI